MANKRKTTPVEYYDPEGNLVTGYFADDHVYQDEAGTVPIAVGSTYRDEGGTFWRMTPYGGVRWSEPSAVDAGGDWIPQGDHWYREAQDLTETLGQREPFAWDPEEDPAWLGAKDRYLKQGRRAMEDAMGRAADLTGGYGSSYGQLVGQQAYAEAMEQLRALLPELYDRAKDEYDAQTRAIYDRLGALTGMYDLDYRTYQDKLARLEKENALALQLQKQAQSQENWQTKFDQSQANWQAKFDQTQANWQAKFDQSKQQWADRLDRWTQEQARSDADREQQQQSADEVRQEKDREYAFKLAMQGLSLGLSVPQALLTAAGIDPAYAERLRRYYAANP